MKYDRSQCDLFPVGGSRNRCVTWMHLAARGVNLWALMVFVSDRLQLGGCLSFFKCSDLLIFGASGGAFDCSVPMFYCSVGWDGLVNYEYDIKRRY